MILLFISEITLFPLLPEQPLFPLLPEQPLFPLLPEQPLTNFPTYVPSAHTDSGANNDGPESIEWDFVKDGSGQPHPEPLLDKVGVLSYILEPCNARNNSKADVETGGLDVRREDGDERPTELHEREPASMPIHGPGPCKMLSCFSFVCYLIFQHSLLMLCEDTLYDFTGLQTHQLQWSKITLIRVNMQRIEGRR